MFYELSIKVIRVDKNGSDKEVVEKYITDATLFSEAECVGLGLYNNDCDVVAIRRSKITEIINDKELDVPFFKAIICDTFLNDDGSEKEADYQVLVCAKDVKSATEKTLEYMKQGYNMELKSISKTKIIDVLK